MLTRQRKCRSTVIEISGSGAGNYREWATSLYVNRHLLWKFTVYLRGTNPRDGEQAFHNLLGSIAHTLMPRVSPLWVRISSGENGASASMAMSVTAK
jgi:hypothetical protein